MQLMIDMSQETPTALRLAAKFIEDNARLQETTSTPQPIAAPSVPTGTAPNGTHDAPLPAVPSIADLDEAKAMIDWHTAQLKTALAQPSAPPYPPYTSPLVHPALDGQTLPPPPLVSNVAPLVPPPPPTTAANGPGQVDDYDSAGMPHDARIHQRGKSKKKDGTWKIQKGIDAALVTSVCQELISQGRIQLRTVNVSVVEPNPAQVFGRASLPAGALAPVSLPPPPPPPSAFGYGQTPQAQDTHQTAAQTLAAPPPPPVSLQQPTVPLPPPTNVGMSDSAQSNVLPVVSEFRALVDKITKARIAGKLTSEQVNKAVQQGGAPSLQMLASMSHLVPVVDAHIDAFLAVG